MIPQKQTILHDPENGVYGNCAQACIASLLGLPLSEVPHFADYMKTPNDHDGFRQAYRRFLYTKGFFALQVTVETQEQFDSVFADFQRPESAINIYHNIIGPSPRFGGGVNHCVIGCNGRLCFDPHPHQTYLAGDFTDWTFEFLMAACDHKPMSQYHEFTRMH